MEAAVASGILKIVGNKLAPLLMKEYSSIVGAKKDLQELHGQVVEINSWLESVGDKAVGNDPSFNWLKELKDIAYEVDDIVDEFQLKAEKHETDGILSKYLWNKPKSIIFQCKVATKIKVIKKKFAAIVRQRKDFSTITSSLPAGHPVHHANITVGEMPLLPNIDAASILGRDKDKDELISKLVEVKDQQTMNIVSIIGLGGSGKTTLAKLVYNDGNIVDKHFEVKLWVHVSSQEFDVIKLIGKLFEAIAGEKSEQYPLQRMSEKISDKLTKKKYLLVLDDVWTKDQILWDQFMVHLKSGAPGSAILLTMRSSDVAGTVRSTYQFSLPFLSLVDSWQLFQQRFGMPVESEFVEVGKQILKKCGGVPLAIKVIAGILRGKELIGEWQAMRDSNLLDVEGEEASVSVSRCLRLSYFHLPSHMKQCFTICSVFPKGYMIDKEQLIDQWITHDMITPQAGVEFLDIGYRYFNSLVQMSFLEDVGEDWYERRVKCRMHDLVHDLALSILDDKLSPVVPKDATSSANSCRYFSLIERPENLAPKNIFRKARAVYMPWSGDYKNVMSLKHAKHLRSVMVGDLDEEGANIISQVKYLKYLSVSSLESCKTLPECISDVSSLQALHVEYSYSLVKIPESTGKLRKLRTLNLSGCHQLKHLSESIGDCEMISSIDLCCCKGLIVLPNSIGKLQKLRRLNLSRCTELKCLPDSIGKLQKLCTLNLSECEELKCLPDSIGDCQMISSLDLCNCKKLTVLPDSIGKLQKLCTLYLSECEELKCLPDSIGDCQMISSIDLCSCKKLKVLPDSIGKLQKLCTVDLSWCKELKCLPDSIGDCQMISSIDLSFCEKLIVLPNSIGRNEKLGVLRLRFTKIERLPSVITTLRNLECLDLEYCDELVALPEGIGNLEKLQVLNLLDCEKLEGMPIGIGQLSRLQKLGLFVVGEGEKFAGISELSNVFQIGDALTIKGIAHVIEPKDAHMACLKQKTHLQKLVLEWMFMDVMEEVNTDDMEEVDIELQQDVLDGLEPPPGIKELHICEYLGRQYAGWMQSQVGGGGVQGPSPFPFLKVMGLCDFPNLKHLHELVGLPCLEKLNLKDMPSLESISGGPFPSLVRLEMIRLPCLGEVWMVAERTIPDEEGGCSCSFTPQLGQFWVGNCLTELMINCCPKLEVKPHLPPSLQHFQMPGSSELLLQLPGQCEGSSSPPNFNQLKKLELDGVTGLGSGHGWELLQHMTTLDSLDIHNFSGVQTMLPKSLWRLTSLRSLRMRYCNSISVLPESIGELRSLQELTIADCPSLSTLPQTIGQLTSIQLLKIEWCNAVHQLPDCLGELCSLRELKILGLRALSCLPESICRLTTSLQELEINRCRGLTSLPQGIEGLTALKELRIYSCLGIQSLPEGIKGLTALKKLWIYNCPDLQRRYEREKGEDWHLISHIPDVSVWMNEQGAVFRGFG